jgi:hypothetical protein
MKKTLTIASLFAVVVTLLAIPTVHAGAGDCEPASKAISDILKKWTEECGKELGGAPDSKKCLAADKFNKLVPKLNAWAANGWATIGPRTIEFGNSQTGTLLMPANRTFLSTTPLEKDSATITVNKKEGKGGATVMICKIDSNGSYTKLKELDFDPDKSTASQTATVSGLQNFILQVYIDGHGGGVGREFKYDLRVTK